MPVLNAEPYLREAVESVLGQSLADLELVAIDDGSTDASPSLLAEYERADPRVRVVTLEHSGLTRALNAGVAASSAPYIARMDADDVALPDRLERQVRYLDEHRDVGVVGGAYVLVDGGGRTLGTVRPPRGDRRLQHALTRYNCFLHATVTIRRAALDEVGGYRLQNAEDYDLWLRIAERYRLAALEEPVLLYRQHGEQFSVARIRSQTFGNLAVRAAARIRRSGGGDPLTDAGPLDEGALRSLGVGEDEIRDALLRDHLRWAMLLLDAGKDEAAENLLTAARAYGGGRSFDAAVHVARAKAAARRGRAANALAHTARAAWRRPLLVARELIGQVRG